jgi:hypothetical protein
MAMMLMLMLGLVLMLLMSLGAVVVLNADALALPAPRLLLVDARAQPPPVLLVPRAQWLASEHQIVVINHCGQHPVLAGQVPLVGVRVGNVDVGAKGARLWCPVRGRALR